jgi:hypothetical protein
VALFPWEGRTQSPRGPKIITICGMAGRCELCTSYARGGGEEPIEQFTTTPECSGRDFGFSGEQRAYALEMPSTLDTGRTLDPAYAQALLSLAGLIFTHIYGDGGYNHINEKVSTELQAVKDDISRRTGELNESVAADRPLLKQAAADLAMKQGAATSELLEIRTAALQYATETQAALNATPPVEIQPETRGLVLERHRRMLTNQVVAALDGKVIREDGFSILGLMNSTRRAVSSGQTALERETHREDLRMRTHSWRTPQLADIARAFLGLSQELGGSRTAEGQALVLAAMAAARGVRYVDSGSMTKYRIPTLSSEYRLGSREIDANETVPDDSALHQVLRLKAERTFSAGVLSSATETAADPTIEEPRKRKVAVSIEGALRLLGAGDFKYSSGDLVTAESRYRDAVAILDAALSIAVPVGMAKHFMRPLLVLAS